MSLGTAFRYRISSEGQRSNSGRVKRGEKCNMMAELRLGII
jgi:hypothetical protein